MQQQFILACPEHVFSGTVVLDFDAVAAIPHGHHAVRIFLLRKCTWYVFCRCYDSDVWARVIRKLCFVLLCGVYSVVRAVPRASLTRPLPLCTPLALSPSNQHPAAAAAFVMIKNMLYLIWSVFFFFLGDLRCLHPI